MHRGERLSTGKLTLNRPSLQSLICILPDFRRHVTSPNQGLPSLASWGVKRRDPGNKVAPCSDLQPYLRVFWTNDVMYSRATVILNYFVCFSNPTFIGHPYSSARILIQEFQLKGWIRTKRAWNGGKIW